MLALCPERHRWFSGLRHSMNPVRKVVHRFMEATGLDCRVDAQAINVWHERRHARRFPVMAVEVANDWIAEVLRANEPAAIGKLGSSECLTLAWHLGLRRFYKYTWTSPAFGDLDLAEQSGVFPRTEEMFHQFAELFLERLQDMDGCAVWHNVGESTVLAQTCPEARRLELRSLEPYFFGFPWSAKLAGKRVLVVHPFESSIRSQFSRREHLWPNHREMLPQFELEVVRSPYGFSKTDFPDWLAMLRWLEQQVKAVHRRAPFDIALIGCGAAGLPLASFVKQLGAIGIHTGGATQLFFGIRGERWDKMPAFQRFFNGAWVRPRPEETPQEAGQVDQGGYW